MAWPLSQDYNEAIQDARGSFSDSELRQGEVDSNALGLPMPRSGNFADVYEVRSGDGKTRWAVKCFTRQVVGLRERYSEISKYLAQAQLPFIVDFQYLEQGIRVRGQWYPVLKMHWVEGFLLNEFVRDNLDRPALLRGLGQIWLRMARKLREARLAHCDLQHGNVILVPGSTASSLAVKLIDYDGMFVPSLAGKKSGEVGHPAYQHPQRLQSGAYNGEVDRFPLLVIATALQSLAVAGRSLWERYDNGDNLLFRQKDLQSPAQSPLFAELREIREPLVQKLVTQLQQSCGQPLEKAPLLESLYPEEKTTTAPRASGARTVSTSPRAAAAQGEEWDFSSPAAGGVSKVRRQSQGTPGWVWALGGAAAALLLMVGAAGAFWMLLGKSSSPLAEQTASTPRKITSTQVARANPPAQEKHEQPVEQKPDDRPRPPVQEETVRTKPVQNVPQENPQRKNNQGFPDLLHAAATSSGRLVAWTHNHGKSWELMEDQRVKYPPFEGHADAVLTIAFSGDGKRILTGSADHTLQLWSVANGQKPMHTFEGHTRPVTHVAVSPDGRWGASIDGGPKVYIWDLEKREKLRTLTNPRDVHSLSFSPSGGILLCGLARPEGTGDNDFAYLWKTNTGERWARVGVQLDQAVTALALSADERYLAIGGKAIVWLCDLGRKGNRKAQVMLRPTALGSEAGPVHHLEFARDNQRYLVSSEKGVYLLGVKGQVYLGRDRPEKERMCACFTADERQIFLAHRYSYHVHTELMNIGEPAQVVVKPPPPPPPPFVPPPAGKLPVPGKDELAAARQKVRQDYKEDFDQLKRDPTKGLDLSVKLIQQGSKQGDAPDYRYALLREAYDLAVIGQDLSRAFWAVTVLSQAFAVSALAERAAAVEAVSRSPESLRNYFLLHNALEVAEEAIAEDDYAQAGRLMVIAQAAAQHHHAANTQALVLQRDRRLQMLRKEYKRVEAAVKKLAKDPDDRDACLAVGKFQCFHKGDWQRGLSLLEKGSDKLLAVLARGDRVVGDDTRNQVGFGDLWWEQAEKDVTSREPLRERARYWYRRALPRLDKEEKAHVEKRLSLTGKVAQLKPGLVTELFADDSFKKKVASRIDYQIDFKWDAGSPDVQVPPEAFSVRWTGWLVLPESGNHALQISSRGGFRILLDGKVLNDQLNTRGGNHSIGADLSSGLHLLQVEYRKGDEPAEIHLSWHPPPGKKGGPIPVELLFHDRQQEKNLVRPRDKP